MAQEITVEGETLTIKRTFTAPVERVYQAWTDPALLAKWFSPNTRWTAPLIEIENKPGGLHNITMRHTDGDHYHNFGKYVEIVPNERISFTWTFLEHPAGPEETLVTLMFRPVPDGTELTLIHDRVSRPDELQSASQGWGGCLDMLDSYLRGELPFGG